MNLESALEIVRFVLGGLLVLANIAVWYGVWLERDSAPLEVQQKGWRILVRGLAAETAVGFLLFAADTSLGAIQSNAIAAANARANQAALAAGRLGVTVDSLPTFVNDRIAVVRAQYASLKAAVDTDVARNNGAILELKRSTADLNRARSDALAAASRSEVSLKAIDDALARQRALTAKIERLTAARVLTPEQISAMVLALKPFPFSGALIIPEWSSPEVSSIAAQIEEVLDRLKGGGADDGVMLLPAQNRPGLPSGISVQFFPGNAAGSVFAAKLVRLLVANGIPASAREEDTGPPDPKAKPLDPNQTELSQIAVYVGLPN